MCYLLSVVRWSGKTAFAILITAMVVGGPALLGSAAPKRWSSVSEARGEPRVVVFITAWCQACRRHMDGLHRLKIPFRTIDIEKDPERYEPLRRVLKRTTVPVTTVSGNGSQRMIVGANSRAVARAYEELAD